MSDTPRTANRKMNDKEKADVMIAAHEGKAIERRVPSLKGVTPDGGEWHLADKPIWNWFVHEYRVAQEKAEPLECWVNKNDNELGYAYSTVEAAETASRQARFSHKAVHMREVQPIEKLEHGVWHRVGEYLKVRRQHNLIEFGSVTEMNPWINSNEIPALIQTLKGLEGGEAESDCSLWGIHWPEVNGLLKESKTTDLFVWAAVFVETGEVDMEVHAYDDDLLELSEGFEWRKFRLVPEKENGKEIRHGE